MNTEWRGSADTEWRGLTCTCIVNRGAEHFICATTVSEAFSSPAFATYFRVELQHASIKYATYVKIGRNHSTSIAPHSYVTSSAACAISTTMRIKSPTSDAHTPSVNSAPLMCHDCPVRYVFTSTTRCASRGDAAPRILARESRNLIHKGSTDCTCTSL